MRIDVHHHFHFDDHRSADELRRIRHFLEVIVATQTEHAAQLRALKVQLDKAKAEIVAKVSALETALSNAGATTPEVDAAFADLKIAVQAQDDLNVDAPSDPTDPGLPTDPPSDG